MRYQELSMPGQRYIPPVEEEKNSYHSDKKNHLIDTLLVVTGFIFAISINYVTIFYLYLFLFFLISCILLKSPILFEIMPKSIVKIVLSGLYLLISFLFPLVVVSIYFVKNPIYTTNDYSIVIVASLLSASLFISLLWDNAKDYITNIDDLIRLIDIITIPFEVILKIFLILVAVAFICALYIVAGIIGTIVVTLSLIILFFAYRKQLEPRLDVMIKTKMKKKIERCNREILSFMLLVIIVIIASFMWYITLFFIMPYPVGMPHTEYVIQCANISINDQTYRLENVSIIVSTK